MKLIADSGSTKTDWLLIDKKEELLRATTPGMNPALLGAQGVKDFLKSELRPMIPSTCNVSEVHFFGAGVSPEQRPVVEGALGTLFPSALVEAQSDLMGAALALCGNRPGICCILGTGSNSCLFSGSEILQNTPALGYIIGDEGSGAVVGRKMLSAMLKGVLPKEMKEEFLEREKLTVPIIINKVYREPMANRFLASIARFAFEKIEDQRVERLAVDSFREFLRVNVAPYFLHPAMLEGRVPEEVNFVGSMAHFFRPQLETAIREEGMKIGTVMRSPIDGLKKLFS